MASSLNQLEQQRIGWHPQVSKHVTQLLIHQPYRQGQPAPEDPTPGPSTFTYDSPQQRKFKTKYIYFKERTNIRDERERFPSPLQYNCQYQQTQKQCISTKILERYDVLQAEKDQNQAPGPATRNLRENKLGKYTPVAQQIGVQATMIDLTNKSLRRQKKLPSPLSYDKAGASKYLSPLRNITLKGRPKLPYAEIDVTSPGPGEYDNSPLKKKTTCRKLESNLTDYMQTPANESEVSRVNGTRSKLF